MYTLVITTFLGILVGLVSCASLEYVKRHHDSFMLPALVLAVGCGMGAPSLFPVLLGFYQAAWMMTMLLWVLIGSIIRWRN
ncbi:hypothetical protein BH10CYA1_BH10CYA1_32380 [soil metagenome]